MKISVDDIELFTVTPTQKKVLCNNTKTEELEATMKYNLNWVLMHKYEQCFKRLKNEWEPKLKALGVSSIPTDNDALAELIFARPEFKDRAIRDAEAALLLK